MQQPNPLELVHVQITFDSLIINASFLDQQSAAEWVAATLGGLLRAYPIGPASRIEVRRL